MLVFKQLFTLFKARCSIENVSDIFTFYLRQPPPTEGAHNYNLNYSRQHKLIEREIWKESRLGSEL